VPHSVPLRGVIEGFYGPPWSPDARLDVIEFAAGRGMNAYVYAPKDDAKHRAQWREPYDAAGAAHFHDLAGLCAKVGVRLGWAISPGLDIDYASTADRAALLGKLVPMLEHGVEWIVLALDDIPTQPRLATGQAALAGWLLEVLREHRADATLTLVPTEYVGTRPTPYLATLAAELPAAAQLMWTGPTVCSPTITEADARAWAVAVGGRPPIVWDNFPVNDGPMDRGIHLGPYEGREPGLTDAVAGILLNPMIQAHGSKIALATAVDFLTDPAAYDATGSWERAVAEVGGRRAPALASIAAACADSALRAPEKLEAHHLVTAVSDEFDGPGWMAPLAELKAVLDATRAAAAAWADDPVDPLATELAPWLAQAAIEAQAGLAALRLLQQVRPVASVGPGRVGLAAAPDAELAMMHAFGAAVAWTAARGGDRRVFGPRSRCITRSFSFPTGAPASTWAGASSRTGLRSTGCVASRSSTTVAGPRSRPTPCA
jgi:hyaluronoglucosaminidase